VFGGTGLCSYRVRGVGGSCAEHSTKEAYTTWKEMLFWMRSETCMSKINLQRGKLTVENRKSREKKRLCSEVSVNRPDALPAAQPTVGDWFAADERARQQTRRCRPMAQTDRQPDTRPLHRPSSAYYKGSINNYTAGLVRWFLHRLNHYPLSNQEFYPQDGGESQLALKLRHCHLMYSQFVR